MGKENNTYFLLDSRNTPLAKGELIGVSKTQTLQFRILDDKIDEVMKHEQIRLVPLASGGEVLLGRIVRSRNDIVVLEKLKNLDSDMRQNLRMPTDFKSFIYPLTGQWKGRRKVQSNDLSCSGVAFFCADELEVGEEFEFVVPITSQPLILRSRILRKRPSAREDAALYAAQFVDLCNDEEMVVREAVFSVQVHSRPKHTAE